MLFQRYFNILLFFTSFPLWILRQCSITLGIVFSLCSSLYIQTFQESAISSFLFQNAFVLLYQIFYSFVILRI